MSIFKKTINQKYFLLKAFLLIFGIFIGTIAIAKLLKTLGYELMLPYTWDSPIYWAVGRGILNGLVPYSDMYENKPPGVFLISALSFALTGDVYICSILSAVCQAVVGLTPFLAVLVLLKRHPLPHFRTLMLSGVSLGAGTLLTMYCQKRSGQFQIETIGAAFICIYILIIAFLKTKELKIYSPSLIVSGFFIMCSVMFKEPFVIIAVACALCFSENLKDVFFKIIIPLVYGGIMSILLLLFSGTLVPYFTIYLPHMLSSHISIYGSPFLRGLKIYKLSIDIIKFSNGLMLIILIAILFFAVNLIKKSFKDKFKPVKRRIMALLLQIVKFAVILYSVSFCVGLGGQYYNHHYVFAVPFYVSVLIIVLKYAYDTCSKPVISYHESPSAFLSFYKAASLCLVLFFIFSAAIIKIPYFKNNQTILYNNVLLRKQAKYVDELLDACGVDRYQYLGFNGDCFYGFTEHSPLGPVFVQDTNNFKNDNTWFTENILKQLDEAQIIIFKQNNMSCISDEVREIIKEDFTTEPPNETVENLDAGVVFPYTIYYRIQNANV